MQHSKKYSWKIQSLLTLLSITFAVSLIVIVSAQSPDDRRRSRIRSRFRPKKRIQDSEAAAALAEANENNKDNNEGISGSVVERARQLRTRNRIRARRPQIVTPEPPSLFDDDEVSSRNTFFKIEMPRIKYKCRQGFS